MKVYLSRKTKISISSDYQNIINHMCYCASKLWNVCNYERLNWKVSNTMTYPDWYFQKKAHKNDIWARSLPSQTAQEVAKQVDSAWKSFYALLHSGSSAKCRPPRYKQDLIPVTFMEFAIKHEGQVLKLTISKGLRKHMSDNYNIHEDYLFFESKFFEDMEKIKQVILYPVEKGTLTILANYELPDPVMKKDNGNYLAIDLGLHNFLTCYDSLKEESFIVGRKYLSLAYYYDKKIAQVQSEWDRIQDRKKVKYRRCSKHILRLYQKRRHCINDYLHKITRFIADYCNENQLNIVIDLPPF